ncbi:hypothetical protein EDB83DRAFT_2373812 [Lactarius deliciosus]|nr:hypothetical protein EDB83DRAFT_2373812 [Lactarius deliciosus]
MAGGVGVGCCWVERPGLCLGCGWAGGLHGVSTIMCKSRRSRLVPAHLPRGPVPGMRVRASAFSRQRDDNLHAPLSLEVLAPVPFVNLRVLPLVAADADTDAITLGFIESCVNASANAWSRGVRVLDLDLSFSPSSSSSYSPQPPSLIPPSSSSYWVPCCRHQASCSETQLADVHEFLQAPFVPLSAPFLWLLSGAGVCRTVA